MKKSGKGNKPGLAICAGGLYTFQNVLDKTDWNENEIIERATWMSNQAKNVWKL